MGKCILKITNPRTGKYRLKFAVVQDETAIPLLDSTAVQAMNLIKIQQYHIKSGQQIQENKKTWSLERMQKEFSEVFKGDGQLDRVYKIEIDRKVKPIKLSNRKVLVFLVQPLKYELQSLQSQGMIQPVQKTTN